MFYLFLFFYFVLLMICEIYLKFIIYEITPDSLQINCVSPLGERYHFYSSFVDMQPRMGAIFSNHILSETIYMYIRFAQQNSTIQFEMC